MGKAKQSDKHSEFAENVSDMPPEVQDEVSEANQKAQAENQASGTGSAAEQALCDKKTGKVEDELELAEQLLTVSEELEKGKDRILRLEAEKQNIQKRSAAELEKSRKYGIASFATELLDVKESLEQACEVELKNNSKESFEAMHNGVELTLKQLNNVFQKFSVEEIAPQPGERFDTELHQAMTMQPSEEIKPNHIVATFRKGFKLHDRLLRPAMVIVAQKPAQVDEGQVDDSGKETEPEASA